MLCELMLSCLPTICCLLGETRRFKAGGGWVVVMRSRVIPLHEVIISVAILHYQLIPYHIILYSYAYTLVLVIVTSLVVIHITC